MREDTASHREPDRRRAADLYRRAARGYDHSPGIRIAGPVRHRAIRQLDLRPGDTVLDIACGTGLNLAGLRAGVGTQGRVVGVDLSPDMLELARRRVERHGWDNIDLVQDAVQAAPLPMDADAAFFSFAHDVLQSPDAIDHVLAALTPAARVVSAGAMWPRLPPALAEPIARAGARRYSTAPGALQRPWQQLAARINVDQITRLPAYAGAMYILSGRTRNRT